MTATNLLDLADAVVRDSPDVQAFVEPTSSGVRRITFGEWAAAADGVARALLGWGIAKGDVVAIALPSSIDYAVAYQGILRAGAIATGINPRLGRTEVDHIVSRCQPKLVIDGPPPSTLGGDPFTRHVELVDSDPVAIVWTGGTTGLPKGAWFDHACLRAMADGAAPLSEIGDRRLSPLPFAHVGYMTRIWDELVHRITTVIVPAPWTASAAVGLIERERVTVCQGVPTQYRMMLDDPALASCDTSSLRIVSGDGNPAPPGDVGAILLRSRAMMRGYWNDPEQTAAAIDDEGWLHTGDLGWVDGGNLRLAGRTAEMYIRGGNNVYPIEIENCLGAHPALVASAVLGTDVDDRLGEIGVVFAVPRDGFAVELDDVRSFVAERLAGYKAPDVLVLVEALPLTTIGKVDKRALRERADEEASRWRRVHTQ